MHNVVFAYYDIEEKEFVVEHGEYKICVGNSYEDIRVEADITL